MTDASKNVYTNKDYSWLVWTKSNLQQNGVIDQIKYFRAFQIVNSLQKLDFKPKSFCSEQNIHLSPENLKQI